MVNTRIDVQCRGPVDHSLDAKFGDWSREDRRWCFVFGRRELGLQELACLRIERGLFLLELTETVKKLRDTTKEIRGFVA